MMMMCKLLKKSFTDNEPQPDVICGKTCYDLPVKNIDPLSSRLVSAYTGPGLGLVSVGADSRSKAFQVPADLATDVAFIDDEDENEDGYLSSSTNNNSPEPAITSKNDSYYSSKFDGYLKKREPAKTKWNEKVSSCNGTSSILSKVTPATSSPNLNSSSLPDSISSSTTPSNSSLPLLEEVAGVCNWSCPSENAFGMSVSLYEQHPTTNERAGEPIADSFGICVRENSAILALADGVNWGEGACIASRSAIHGSIDYLNKALYLEGGAKVNNTMDLFICLLRSFSAAHSMILQENGKLTTLTVAIIAQLKNSDKCAVCTCNVGDSFAYVYSKKHGVREITQGSHDIHSMRDMRSALGALGPVEGTNPELNNLTVAMTIVEQGDIVFLASDGISDNFDPVVGKFALPKKPDSSTTTTTTSTDNNNKTRSNNGDSNNIKNSEKHNNKANGSSDNKTTEKVATKNKINSRLFCARSNSVKSSSKSSSSSANHRTSRRKSEGLISRITEDLKLSSLEGRSKNGTNRHHSKESSRNHHHSNGHSNGHPKDSHNNNTSTSKKSSNSIMTTLSKEKSSSKDNNNGSKDNKVKRSHSLNEKSSSSLPVVTAIQRHELSLLRMEDIIRNGFNSSLKQSCTTARQLCELLIEWSTKLTTAKRRILEDPELYDDRDTNFDHTDQRIRRRQVGSKLYMLPGKLDHASIVACKVAFYGDYANKRYYPDGDVNKYNLKLKATLAKIESHED